MGPPAMEGHEEETNIAKGSVDGNPKSETRNPKQIRNSNIKGSKLGRFGHYLSCLISIWNLFRISSFGFRILFPLFPSASLAC